MRIQTPKTRADKKNDYWYLDRAGRRANGVGRTLHQLMLISCLGLALLSSACTAGFDQQMLDADPATQSASRGTSELVGTVLDTTATVTAPAETLLKAVVSLEGDQQVIQLPTCGEALVGAQVYTVLGEALNFRLDGTTTKVAVPASCNWTHIGVLSSSGGKWYFDNAGLPLPSGYCPTVKFAVVTDLHGNRKLAVKSSSAFDAVAVYYANGTREVFLGTALSGQFKVARKPLAGFGVRLRSDGSKWYFDAAGESLPVSSKWFADMD